MKVSRRQLLQFAGGVACTKGMLVSKLARADTTAPSIEVLDDAAAAPILDVSRITSPVVIESVELLQGHDDYFVRVRSKNGAVGIAVANSRAALLHPIFNQLVAPYFVGKDARDLEEHLFGVYRHDSNYKLQSLALWCPVAWIEFAILDMLGRIAKKSIGELLGGVVREEVPFYVASSRRDSTAEQEVKYLQRLIEATGARAVKYRVGGRMSRNQDASPGRTAKLIPLSRKALGDNIDIHADSNSSYDPPQAIEVGRMLEDIGAVYFEEPCPFDHWEDTKQVTDTLAIPIAGGEQESSERRFRWAIANRAVDIVQPDLQYYGGMIRSRRVARMAELAGMPTTVHISGGFGFVYMLHFASCTKDVGKYQEYKQGIERYNDWFAAPITVRDGAMSVPTGPGVGIVSPDEVLKGAKRIM